MATQNPKYNIVLGAKIAPKSLESLEQTITSFFQNKTFAVKLTADTSELEKALRNAGGGTGGAGGAKGKATGGLKGTSLKGSNVLSYTEAQTGLGETIKRTVKIQKDENTVITETQDAFGTLTGKVKSYDTGLKAQLNSIKRADTAYAKVKSRIKDLGDQHIIGKQAVEKFSKQLEDANKIADPAKREAEIKRINQSISDSKKQVMGFGEMLSTALEKFSVWSIVTVAWYKVVAALKDVAKEVVALDTALVELNKVTDLTEGQTEKLTQRAYRLAEQVGQTGLEAINAITEVKRAGFTLEESETMAKYALMLTNVAEGITDAGDAAQVLISIIKGTGAEVSYASTLLDEMNEISNNSAIAFDALAHMTQEIAGTMHTLGASTEETMSLVTAAYEVLQDERVAKGVSVIGLRISGLNEDLEEEAGLQSKVNDALMKYAHISVFDEQTGQLRNYYDILSDLASVWDSLDKNAKSYLTTELAGKNRADVLTALMTNWEGVTKAMAYAEQSAGSAAHEQERYLESVQGKLAVLKSAWQELSQTTLDSEVIKQLLEMATALTKVATATGGLIPVLGLLGGALLALKTITSLDWNTAVGGIHSFKDALTALQMTASGAMGTMAALKLAIGSVVAVVSLLAMAISAIDSAQRQAIQTAQAAASKAKTQAESIKDLVDQYKALADAQEGGAWGEEQRKKVETIQSSITDLVGEEAKNLDLVNGKLDEQYQKLLNIAKTSTTTAEYEAEQALLKSAQRTLLEEIGHQSDELGSVQNYRNPAIREWLKSQGIQLYGADAPTMALTASLQYGGTTEEIIAQYNAVTKLRDKLAQAYLAQEDVYDEAGNLIYAYEEIPKITEHLNYYIDKVGDSVENYLKIRDMFAEGGTTETQPTETTDPVLERMRSELDLLKEQQAATKSLNEEQEKELELQEKLLAVEEAREALAQAKNKRLLVYRAGHGMVYEQDYAELETARNALITAQKNLSDYEQSEGLDELSKKIASLETAINERMLASKGGTAESTSSASGTLSGVTPTINGVPVPSFRAFGKTSTSSGKTTNYNIGNVQVNYSGDDLEGLAGAISRAAVAPAT